LDLTILVLHVRRGAFLGAAEILFVQDLDLEGEEDSQFPFFLGSFQLANQALQVRAQMVLLQVQSHPAGPQVARVLQFDQLLDRELDRAVVGTGERVLEVGHQVVHLRRVLVEKAEELSVPALLGEIRQAAGQALIQVPETVQVDQGVPASTRGHVGEEDQMILAQVAQRQQGIQPIRGHHLDPQAVVDDLGDVVGLVEKFEDQAVATLLLLVEDVQKGDGERTAPQGQSAPGILVDVLFEAIQDLALDLGEELGAQRVVDVADGVHDAQQGAGPGLTFRTVAIGGPDQEVPQIGGTLDIRRDDNRTGRVVGPIAQVALDEGQGLHVDAPGHLPVLLILHVIPVLKEELVGLLAVHQSQGGQVDGGVAFQDRAQDIPGEIVAGLAPAHVGHPFIIVESPARASRPP